MKAVELVNALGFKAGKSITSLVDNINYNAAENDLNRINLTENVLNRMAEKNNQEYKAPSYLKGAKEIYSQVPTKTNATKWIKKQEQESIDRLKQGNNKVENVITDVALSGGNMLTKGAMSIATGLPLSFIIGADSAS